MKAPTKSEDVKTAPNARGPYLGPSCTNCKSVHCKCKKPENGGPCERCAKFNYNCVMATRKPRGRKKSTVKTVIEQSNNRLVLENLDDSIVCSVSADADVSRLYDSLLARISHSLDSVNCAAKYLQDRSPIVNFLCNKSVIDTDEKSRQIHLDKQWVVPLYADIFNSLRKFGSALDFLKSKTSPFTPVQLPELSSYRVQQDHIAQITGILYPEGTGYPHQHTQGLGETKYENAQSLDSMLKFDMGTLSNGNQGTSGSAYDSDTNSFVIPDLDFDPCIEFENPDISSEKQIPSNFHTQHDLNISFENLRKQEDELKKSIEDMKGIIARSKGKIVDLEKRREAEDTSLANQKKKLESLRKESEENDKYISKQKRTLEKLKEQCDEEDKYVTRKKRTLEKLKEQCDEEDKYVTKKKRALEKLKEQYDEESIRVTNQKMLRDQYEVENSMLAKSIEDKHHKFSMLKDNIKMMHADMEELADQVDSLKEKKRSPKRKHVPRRGILKDRLVISPTNVKKKIRFNLERIEGDQ